jgi:cysteine-rich repeat protein/parallel beta-helix repeat protein
MNKKGSVLLTAILIAVALGLSAGVYVLSETGEDDSITGAMVGIQTRTVCNLTVNEDLNNIGHDYECTGEDGFIIGADNIVLDCQNHTISCMSNCAGFSGIKIESHSNVTVRNCNINRFDSGILIKKSTSQNNYIGPYNVLLNNTNGIKIENASLNNLTYNWINNSNESRLACGINISDMNNAGVNWSDTANYIWDNIVYNFSNGTGACSDSSSYNYWNVEKVESQCFNENITNIIGGPCIGGNYWGSYGGVDSTGDGFGNSGIPYKAGGISAADPIGDNYPLVDPCALPGVICGNVECPNVNLATDSGGEGIAIVCDNSVFKCGGTRLAGNNESEDDMRGIEVVGVSNVTVEGCEIEGFKYGIYVRDADNVTIKDNNVHDNMDTGVYIGDYSKGALVTLNNITNEHSTLYQTKGIWLRTADATANGGGYNNISSNLIRNQTYAGIYLSDNSDINYIESNNAFNNTYSCLINNSKGNMINSNSFYDSSIGLWVLDATTVDFGEFSNNLENSYYNNSEAGLKIEGSSSDSYVEGIFYNNTYGAWILDSNVTIGGRDSYYSQVYNNTKGIYVQHSEDVGLGKLNVTNNFYTGIHLDNVTGTYLESATTLKIFDNPYGLIIDNSSNTNFYTTNYGYGDELRVYNNTINVWINWSSYNNLSGWYIYNATKGIMLNNSDNNLIYNNNISRNAINAQDAGNNLWNISKNISDGNIVDGDYLGGNYWSDYDGDDISGDGIGDNGTIPWKSSGTNITNGGDELPLIPVAGNVSCGTISHSIDLTSDVNATDTTGNCFTVTGDDVTLDCDSHTIKGNASGIGVNVTNKDSFTLKNCIIEGFNQSVYFHGSNYSNMTLNTINGSWMGVLYTNSSNHGFVSTNTIDANTIGFQINSSTNNTIYNNFVNSTVTNAMDDGSANEWNTTYNCNTGENNIIGVSCWGGNFWSDYTGGDAGNGSGAYNTTPWNISSDGIGDDQIPYNNSNSLTGGADYLPLLELPITCGNLTESTTLTQNLESNGTCFTVQANDITINLAGYSITGNDSGIGINITSYSNIKVLGQDGLITNFSTGIYIDPATGINITGIRINETDTAISLLEVNNSFIGDNNLTSNSWGIYLNQSYNNTLTTNNLTSNTYGLELVTSENNNIFNNAFSNTNNALDDGSVNEWNSSFTETVSIIGGTFSGGNFWSDYEGKDLGGGTYPYNETGDGVGDTDIPYATGITGGDYLPLTNDDGSLDDCVEISEDYILSQDLTCSGDDGITIAADDLTLDCNGFNINGTGVGAGISISNRENIVIRNCNITNFYYGIKSLNSREIQIIETNRIEDNDFYGIYLYQTNETLINESTIVDDNNGVYMISSEGINITDNVIDLNRKFYGIYSYGSNNNLIYNNSMTDNYHGVYLVNSDNANVSNNVLDDSDVYSVFLHSTSDSSVFESNELTNSQQAIRIKGNSGSNTFINNTMNHHSDYGLYSTDSSSNTFTNNTFTNCSGTSTYGIYLTNSSYYTFTNNSLSTSAFGFLAVNASSMNLNLNNINANNAPCMIINGSDSITLINNTIQNDLEFNNVPSSSVNNNTLFNNVQVDYCNSLTFSQNNVTNIFNITNSDSVMLSSNTLATNYFTTSTSSTIDSNTLNIFNITDFSSGTINNNEVDSANGISFYLQNVDSCTISNNDVQSTSGAFYLNESDSNTIYTNWVKDNTFGLNLTSTSTGNTIYDNYFENTVTNVHDDIGNTWYTTYACGTPNIVGGPCIGGNFYSDYYGLDNGANGREQGDGIGDQPSFYTINPISVTDIYPLVLYVARQYYAPTDTDTLALTATGSVSGTLDDEEVVPNEPQTITYSVSGNSYFSIFGLFNQTDVHAETLLVHYNDNKTYVNKSTVTGVENNYSVYVHHNNRFDAGVYICENIVNFDSVNTSCTSQINFTSFPGSNGGVQASATDTYYLFENVINNSFGVGLIFDNVCGSNIFHDVTFTEDVSCNGYDNALTVTTDNITIDFGGYSLIGNGTGIGLNISDYDNVTILNANIQNFSTAIYADPAVDINISGALITNNSVGIDFTEINNSFIGTSNITNNTIGIQFNNAHNNTIYTNYVLYNDLGLNLSSSNNNLIYNNYINNTNDTWSDGTNDWNSSLVSGTNIFGGSYIGGNFWANYTGWDTDLDGMGETLVPYNNSHNIAGGDNYPLTTVGYMGCGQVPVSVTLNQDLTTTTGNCLQVTADNVVIDCAGYSITGNGTAGIGVFSSGYNNVSIQNCDIKNFTVGTTLATSDNSTIYSSNYSATTYGVNLDNSLNINVSDNDISNSSYGLLFIDANDSTIYGNFIRNNTIGISIVSTENNTFYNNYIDSTSNNTAGDGSTNKWNVTYGCVTNYTNIVGGNCTGGNFWGDYVGLDNGSGVDPYNITPWNISGDGIGDTSIPYNNSGNFTPGDYLPLLSPYECGDGDINGSEQCDDGNTAWGDSCSPTCTITYACNNQGDDDADGLSDTLDSGCHTDYNASNSSSYNSTDDDETYCGDSVCETGESCSSCSADCGACPTSSSSSSSSGGGGGGGGGGGSSSSSSSGGAEEICTESWTCTTWSDCEDDEQTRTCTENNDCGTEDNKPDETQECEVEVTYVENISEVPGSTTSTTTDEPDDIPFIPAFIEEPSPVRTLTLSSLAVLLVFGGVFVYWEFAKTSSRLRRKLKKSGKLISDESVEAMKGEYKGIYNLYLKLSEKEKRNFYTGVTNLREKIEEQLKAEKIVQELMRNSGKGSIPEQKKTYLKIYKEYQKLPPKSQEKYYPKIVNLRERLEKGRVA